MGAFYIVESSRDKKVSGTGRGLSIVRAIKKNTINNSTARYASKAKKNGIYKRR